MEKKGINRFQVCLYTRTRIFSFCWDFERHMLGGIFCTSYVIFRTTNFGWGSGEGSVTIVSTFSCTSLSWEWDCRAAAASQRLYGLDHIDSHFYTWRNYPYKGQMKEKGAKNWESMVFLSDHMSEWFQVSKVILCVQILLQSVTDWRRRRPRVGAELAGFCYIIRHYRVCLKPPVFSSYSTSDCLPAAPDTDTVLFGSPLVLPCIAFI